MEFYVCQTYLSPRGQSRKPAVYDLVLGLPAWFDVLGGKTERKYILKDIYRSTFENKLHQFCHTTVFGSVYSSVLQSRAEVCDNCTRKAIL